MDGAELLDQIVEVADTNMVKQMVMTLTLRDDKGNEEEKQIRIVIMPEDINASPF